MRDAIIRAIHARFREEPSVFLTNDFGAPALDALRKEFPTTVLNAGIAEQNLIGVACGMAHLGLRPYIYSIASFLILRALEQIKVDMCIPQLPVTILGVGPGYAYDLDGPTHHLLEDVAILRTLPITILSPRDNEEAASIIPQGPTYVRLDRGSWPPSAPYFRDNGGTLYVTFGTMFHSIPTEWSALGLSKIPLSDEDWEKMEGRDIIVVDEQVGGLVDIIRERQPAKAIYPRRNRYSYGTREELRRRSGLCI